MDSKLTPILVNADERRDFIRGKAVDAIKDFFPVIGSRYDIHLEDVNVKQKDFSSQDQKNAVLDRKSLYEPVKGVLTLRDKSGNVIETSRPTTLLNLPWFTERHSFVVDGNEYSVANQVRLKPGVYARRRGNSELEAQFNVLHLFDNKFKINMDPETGHMKLQHGTSNIPLYPVLRALGQSDAQISRAWGSELAEVNAKAFNHKKDAAVKSLYNKLTPTYARNDKLDTEGKVQHIRDQYAKTYLDPNVTKRTLGKPYDKVSPDSILRASEKLLNIYKKAEETDDRDSLAFKTMHQVDDFIKEKIHLDGRSLKKKIKQKLDHTSDISINKVLPSNVFTPGIRKFVTMSALSAIPTQINPLEILDVSQRVTALGEGGIGSERAIPSEARNIHATHLGILDTVRTPESSKAGVDLRAAIHAARDVDGNMYAPMRNAKTMKVEYVPATELADSVVAFQDQVDRFKKKKKVEAIKKGRVAAVDAGEVQYFVPHSASTYSPLSTLVPFLDSMQGNRAVMASKHITQALPLKFRETPLVQVESYRKGRTMERDFGEMLVPKSPVDGEIYKVDDDYIYIKPNSVKSAGTKVAASDLIKVKYNNNYPLATKTSLHNDISVKAGDSVKKDQLLGDSTSTIDGTVALGKNLKVGIMAYNGLNSNDAVVISEGAAKKLTSMHTYKESHQYESDSIKGKDPHRTHFGNKYTVTQYNKLDSDGVAKKGTKLSYKDPVIVSMKKTQLSPEAMMLGKLHKSLVKPYRDDAVLWEHEHEGTVIDVSKSNNRVMVIVKTEEPMGIGDKLTGRHGNKGVVSKIVSDDHMPRDENGDPLDVLQTSASVVSRINPSQILEMAAGKVAQKTGKPIAVPLFADHDNVQWAKDLLKKHGVKDKETVYDPVANKYVKGINVGPMFIMKLMKTTATNYSARGIENYDTNQQPSKGGESGAKGTGRMELAALIAHDARNILKENAVLKSQKNDEYWQRVRLGLPPPPPKTSFAYDRFGSMLTGMGVKHVKDDNKIALGPLTDNDVKALSQGTVKNPLFLRAKDLKPEPGGLFDVVATGGTNGTKYTHIDLDEHVVNPVFEEPARRLLDMTGAAFKKHVNSNGAEAVKKELNALDTKGKLKDLYEQSKRANGSKLDGIIKQIKYLEALKNLNLKPGDAYVMSKIPVVPPVTRPVIPSQRGDLLINDVNYLYRDVMLANEAMKMSKDLPKMYQESAREHLQDSVSALFGLRDSVSPQNQARGVKGFMTIVSGKGSPKYGYFQNKLVKRQLDLSGRGTAAPDINLGMDELGMPEDMMWKTYEPFIVGRLVRRGYMATQAKQMWKDRHPAAREELLKESKARPVYWNRAPTLHKHNIIAAYAKPIPGKTIRVPATWPESGMNLDYDGDAIQVHVPATHAAVEDAKKMVLSNLLFGDKNRGDLLVKPAHEAVIGVYKATMGSKTDKPTRKFKNREDALAAYRRNEIGIDDPVEIG